MSDENAPSVTGAMGATTLPAVTPALEATVRSHEARSRFLTEDRRVYFEERGEEVVLTELPTYDNPVRFAAFAWLKERRDTRAEQSRLRHEAVLRYARRTFWAAVAAVVIGLVGVAVTVATVLL